MTLEHNTWGAAFRLGKNWCLRGSLLGFVFLLILSGGEDFQLGHGGCPWLLAATLASVFLGLVGFVLGFGLGRVLLFMGAVAGSTEPHTDPTRPSPVFAGFWASVSSLAYIGWRGILFPGYTFQNHPAYWRLQAFLGSLAAALLVYLYFRSYQRT